MMNIRSFVATDGAACANLFYDAIHHGAQDFYTVSERQAWCSVVPATGPWTERLLQEDVCLVAEQVDSGKVMGFMTLSSEGYIDLAFVHSQAIRQSVGSKLLQAIENKAKEWAVPRLTTDASLMAEHFFAKHGFVVMSRKIIDRDGEKLANARMEKNLN